MSKQQTAVEWFIDKLSNYDSKIIELFEKEIEQANKMFEQQIIEAYLSDRFPCSDEDAEEYYNETYGK